MGSGLKDGPTAMASTNIQTRGKKREIMGNYMFIDDQFVPLLQMHLKAGRNLSASSQTDLNGGFLVNEAFVKLAGWQQGLSLLSGGLMALLVLTPERWLSRGAAGLGLDVVLSQVKRRLAHFYQQPSLGALYATGLLNGLLPCGMVYLALAGALSAPGVAGAVAYMALFGLGTLPLMLALALSRRLLPLPWRRLLRRAGPVLALGLAGLFILRGLGLGIPYLSPLLSRSVIATHLTSQPASQTWCHGPVSHPANN